MCQEKERTEGPRARETQWSGRRGSIEWGGLIERDITGDANTMSNKIITTITLMLKTITQKNTGDRLGSELCSLLRGKQNKTTTTKHTKMIVAGRGAMKTLTRATITKTRRRLKVDEINSSADSISPEMRWDGRPKKKGTSRLQDMTMLALSNPVLRMSPRTG